MTTETGTSEAVIVRAAVSMKIMMLAPSSRQTGIRYRLSDPVSIRAACGTMSPIHPTCPHREITEAVTTVAHTISVMRRLRTSTPAARASSSDRASTLSRHRRTTMPPEPMTMKGAASAICDQDAPAREPMSQ